MLIPSSGSWTLRSASSTRSLISTAWFNSAISRAILGPDGEAPCGPPHRAAALCAGVSGYLLKDSSSTELVHSAKLAMEGKVVIHPTLTRAFIEEVQYLDHRPDTPLSRRESEILQKVAYGASTKEVAHALGISPHTVKTHLERIFEKLGANDRAQAVAIALRRGLVD